MSIREGPDVEDFQELGDHVAFLEVGEGSVGEGGEERVGRGGQAFGDLGPEVHAGGGDAEGWAGGMGGSGTLEEGKEEVHEEEGGNDVDLGAGLADCAV